MERGSPTLPILLFVLGRKVAITLSQGLVSSDKQSTIGQLKARQDAGLERRSAAAYAKPEEAERPFNLAFVTLSCAHVGTDLRYEDKHPQAT